MNTKRKNPYTALLEEVQSLLRNIKYRHTVTAHHFPIEKLKPETGWKMDDVYQSVITSKKLGYETVIVADEKGMTIQHKKIIEAPFHLRPD